MTQPSQKKPQPHVEIPDEALRSDLAVEQEGDRCRQAPEWGKVEYKLVEMEEEEPAAEVR